MEDPSESMADQQLILTVQTGDRAAASAALDILVLRHGPPLLRWLRSKGNSTDESEDLSEETWERALRKILEYVYEGKPFTAWLIGIARNVVREYQRDLRKFGSEGETDLSAVPHPDNPDEDDLVEALDREQALVRMSILLERAPVDYAKFIEAYREGFSTTEIMQLYEWSQDKTYQTKRRAILWLREHWTDEISSPPSPAEATP